MRIIQILTESINHKNLITSDIKHIGDMFAKDDHEIRIVGGAVRDAVLGKDPKDIDLATTATPEEMLKIAKENNIKYIETGLQHGTITIVINGEPYEITTLRVDVDTDGRHADVEWTKSFKEDARRRDLTFNAMSVDMNGQLHDYFNGVKDLKNGTARFVGNTEERIQEDYLRILRYFRFLGKQSNPKQDDEILSIIKKNIVGLTNISGERIWVELQKILSGNNISFILNMMWKVTFFDVINLNNPKGITNAERSSKMGAMPITCLCWLVDDMVTMVKTLNRLKVSKLEQQVAHYVLYNKDVDLNENRNWERELVLKGVDARNVIELALFNGDKSLATKIQQFKMPVFDISGNDLIKQGMSPGPKLGERLTKLKKEWFDNNYSHSD